MTTLTTQKKTGCSEMSGDGFLEDAEEELESSEEDEQDNEIEVVDTEPSQDLIKPVTDDLSEIAQIYEQFEEVKSDLLTADDRQSISGNVFVTKSGWRKIATAFNISVETTEEDRIVDNGVVMWKVKAVATAPNNVSSTGSGMAASNESNFMEKLKKKDSKDETVADVAINYDLDHEEVALVDGAFRRIKRPREVNEHNIMATAATRAKNRAISDLVGGGEVSSEEMSAEDFISS